MNNEKIYCFPAQDGYKHCATDQEILLPQVELYLMKYLVTTITVINSIFKYNGNFGKVRDTGYTVLPNVALEIARGAILHIVSNSPTILVNVIISSTQFLHNRGRGGVARGKYFF